MLIKRGEKGGKEEEEGTTAAKEITKPKTKLARQQQANEFMSMPSSRSLLLSLSVFSCTPHLLFRCPVAMATMAAAKERAKRRARTFNSAIFDFGHAVIALDFRGGFSVSFSASAPFIFVSFEWFGCICICSRFRRQNEMALTLTFGAICRLMAFSLGTIMAC